MICECWEIYIYSLKHMREVGKAPSEAPVLSGGCTQGITVREQKEDSTNNQR